MAALTNDVSVGTHLFHYEMPDRIIDILVLLRATGRLVWPAFYVVVWLGLAISGAMLYSIVTYLGTTSGLALSLAGVTGIIVSVGITVDSYIVYFERMKDEVKENAEIVHKILNES